MYDVFQARETQKHFVDIKGTLFYKEYSNCIHPCKICLTKPIFAMYMVIYVGIQLKANPLIASFSFLLGNMLNHPISESYLT
jgi:hypothetical protein